MNMRAKKKLSRARDINILKIKEKI